jgi:hypothetical protein
VQGYNAQAVTRNQIVIAADHELAAAGITETPAVMLAAAD